VYGGDDPQEELAKICLQGRNESRNFFLKILLYFGELLEPKCLYMTILGEKLFSENIWRLWRIFSQNSFV
jgi:hypothetical protein